MKKSSKQNTGVTLVNELDKVVIHYLNTETNFCLLIRGGWGIGKTHYLKQQLVPLIEKSSVFKNHSKKYKAICISLFGLNSVDEIQTAILLELLPFLKSKKLKIGKELLKVTIKGIMYLKGMGGLAKSVDESEKVLSGISKNSFDIENLVICFDDFERKGEKLSTEQFIGYVNSLVEHSNSKVLIISNDDKLDSSNVYHKYKEKVIGNSVDFKQDISKVYDSIVTTRFEGFNQYRKFLIKNKGVFEEYFFEHSRNLRTLIFCLSYYQRVYSELDLLCDNDKKLRKISEDVKRKLLAFAITISIEYRENLLKSEKRISSSNTNNIDRTFGYSQMIAMEELNTMSFTEEIDTEVTSYEEQFRRKYFKNKWYTFYNSVYQHLTGGRIISPNELYDEVRKDYKAYFESKKELEVLSKLTTAECFQLTDKEYLESVKEVVAWAVDGVYSIDSYLSIFYVTLKFGNPLNYDPGELRAELEKGLEKIRSSEVYNDSLQMHLDISKGVIHADQMELLKESILKRNEIIQLQQKREIWQELEKLCYSNFSQFVKEVLGERKFKFQPIFSNFISKDFYGFLEKANPSTLTEVLIFFRDQYKDIAPSSSDRSQHKFFEELRQLVKIKDQELKGVSLTGQLFRWLLSTLQRIHPTS